MHRRTFLAAGAAGAALAATRAAAAPILSATNFGLTLAQAQRRNGWIEVDAAVFEANIATLRKIVDPVRICAVMKADAYGNGIALLIRSVIAAGITDVAITSNDEARVARQSGYRGRLYRIRLAPPEEMEDAFGLGLVEAIGNPEGAARLEALWRRHRSRFPLPVHLALNAGGMSRNGVELSTGYGKADARALLALKGLRIAGAMTHYPSEEAPDILGQLARSQEDLAWLAGEGLTAGRPDPSPRQHLRRADPARSPARYGPRRRRAFWRSRLAPDTPFHPPPPPPAPPPPPPLARGNADAAGQTERRFGRTHRPCRRGAGCREDGGGGDGVGVTGAARFFLHEAEQLFVALLHDLGEHLPRQTARRATRNARHFDGLVDIRHLTESAGVFQLDVFGMRRRRTHQIGRAHV